MNLLIGIISEVFRICSWKVKAGTCPFVGSYFVFLNSEESVKMTATTMPHCVEPSAVPMFGLYPGTGRPEKGLQLLPQNWIYLLLLPGHQGEPRFSSFDMEVAKSLNSEKKCQPQGTVSEKEA